LKFIIPIVLVVATAMILAIFFFPKDLETDLARGIPMSPTKVAPKSYGSIPPLRAAKGLNQAKVALGERLFSDPILSDNNTVSCATCHILDLGGTNQLPISIGINGGTQRINVPTVFNSSLNFKQFWDGRADTLEEQVDGPITNPLEMGSTWPETVSRLKANSEYVKQFTNSYSEGITQNTISHAIAEFERSLTTPDSAFDQYLKGDEEALSAEEVEGYKLFTNLGCVRCHQGMGIGGNMFQRMGAKNDYFSNRDDLNKHDMGRFNVTADEFDKHRFKVPSLRNVALTAPYFHDGSAATLLDAVQVMAKYQLGRRLKDREQTLLVSFLKSLTGQYQGKTLGADRTEQTRVQQ
jgi:cytochrome c peroxidase